MTLCLGCLVVALGCLGVATQVGDEVVVVVLVGVGMAATVVALVAFFFAGAGRIG